jgi:hypothetical protein
MLTKPALEEAFVLIVDDWNYEKVRRGTLDGIRDNNYHIDYLVEIRTSLDNSHGPVHEGQSEWHNGYLIAALRKPV